MLPRVLGQRVPAALQDFCRSKGPKRSVDESRRCLTCAGQSKAPVVAAGAWLITSRISIEPQQVEDLPILQGCGFEGLDLVEHVLRQTQIFLTDGLNCFVVIIHLKDGAFLQP